MMTQINHWSPNFPLDSNRKMNFSAIMIAKRRSGKTYLIQYFYENIWHNKFDLIIVFTNAAGADEYAQFMKKNVIIIPGFVPEIIAAIRMTNAARKKQRQPVANVLIIMDDCCSRSQKYSSSILDMYTKGRHDNISIVYSVQDGTLVDNVWKENTDFIFMFKPGTTRTREYIVNNIISGFLDIDFDTVGQERRFYRKIYRKITEDRYHMAITDMNEMKLYWYVAPELRRRRRR